jgi:hypothetical protein
MERIIDLEFGMFDLIILDISGAAYNLSYPSDKPLWEITKDGFGVLQHLKLYNPAQLIIAFWGQTYDLSRSDFLKFADDYIPKPMDLLIWKEKIDTLLKSKFIPQRYWGEIERIFKSEGVSDKDLKGIEQKLISSLLSGKSFPWETIESNISVGAEALTITSILTQTILNFGAK